MCPMPRSPQDQVARASSVGGTVELRAGAVTGLCLSPFRQSVRAVDKIAANSLAIKPDPSSHKAMLPLLVAWAIGSRLRDADLYSCSVLREQLRDHPREFQSIQ